MAGTSIGVQVPKTRLRAASFPLDEPLLAIEASEWLVVYDEALATPEDQQKTVTEPTALAGQSRPSLAQRRFVTPARPVAHGPALTADQLTRPSLADPMDTLEVNERPLGWQRALPVFCYQVFQRGIVQVRLYPEASLA